MRNIIKCNTVFSLGHFNTKSWVKSLNKLKGGESKKCKFTVNSYLRRYDGTCQWNFLKFSWVVHFMEICKN